MLFTVLPAQVLRTATLVKPMLMSWVKDKLQRWDFNPHPHLNRMVLYLLSYSAKETTRRYFYYWSSEFHHLFKAQVDQARNQE